MTTVRPHCVWWLGYWPTSDGLRWWLTHRSLGSAGPGPVADPMHGMVDGRRLAPLLRRLRHSLPGAAAGGAAEASAGVDDIRRAWHGALATAGAEFDLSSRLGAILLPEPLVECLRLATPDEGRADPAHTVVIATGPSLSQIPFDLLVIDQVRGLRLLEAARVRAGLSAAAGVGAISQPDRPATGALRVIDPGPTLRAAAARGGAYAGTVPGPIYHDTGIDARWIDRHGADDQLLHASEIYRPITKEVLADALLEFPRRMLFLGHALSGTADAPAGAGLVLADPESGGPFVPFTAAQWIREPSRWPAPPLVALICCHSNDTHLFEQMGLVQAAMHAGAKLVTSTRWVLPADHTADPRTEGGTTTTDLALAVDAAQGAADPVGALRRWQLSRLTAWRRDPGPASAPLIWAAPVNHQLAELTDNQEDPP